MGKTIRLKLSDPSFIGAEPDKSNHHDKKKKKKEEAQVMRTREKKKLKDAISTGTLDAFAMPIKKKNIPASKPNIKP
ncbi:hypothetical protein OTK49_01415 [Vibrio coralliirubri]|uniref:hypothetical protein n=1 Tax=Vibrio coralliirubri TaxID=1516159 RepID=UPI0022849D8C|nr:hypothetical protein [Vibrio coralliirubri]MCY9861183.1 hypothetical protein [Vibrio coralliirubri]